MEQEPLQRPEPRAVLKFFRDEYGDALHQTPVTLLVRATKAGHLIAACSGKFCRPVAAARRELVRLTPQALVTSKCTPEPANSVKEGDELLRSALFVQAQGLHTHSGNRTTKDSVEFSGVSSSCDFLASTALAHLPTYLSTYYQCMKLKRRDDQSQLYAQ